MNDVAGASRGRINDINQRRFLRLHDRKEIMKRDEMNGIEKGKSKEEDTKKGDIEKKKNTAKREYKEQKDTEKRDEEKEMKKPETKDTHDHDTFQRSHKRFVMTFKPRKVCYSLISN